MKKIKLKKLKLLNFKGLREFSVDLDNITDIYGHNGTGKTTLFDAFLWVPFGKDSTDRKDFEIKTLDVNNQPFHKMSHEVTLVLEVDGDEVTIRRTYKENWPTKKGTATETFSGHTTNFYWNEVPMALNEFQAKVAMIMDEGLFKLLTNTGYFAALKWQDKRVVLENIAGEITNQMVFDVLPGKDFTELAKALNAKKSLQEFKSEISNKKKLIREEKDLLPSRIDEVKRSLPEPVDYALTEDLLKNAQGALQDVENQLSNKTLALQEQQKAINSKMQKVQDLSSQANQIKFEEKEKVQQGKRDRDQAITNDKSIGAGLRQDISNVDRDFQNDTTRKNTLLSSREALLTRWHSINNEKLEFNAGEFCCPTCKRDYEAADVEARKADLTKNFNQNKSTRLSQVDAEGKKIAAEISEIDVRLTDLQARKEAIQENINTLLSKIVDAEAENVSLSANDEQVFQGALEANLTYQKIIGEINTLNEEISMPLNADDNSELLTKKQALASQVTQYQSALSSKDHRTKLENRITELTNQESELANKLAEYEGIEFSILQFEKAKMDMLETKVNGMFQKVRFKMFEDQINGGQVPCCIALIDGVPYSDANTASKIQAGVDIINTLSRHYNISAPIFIDNRESVIEIPKTESQVISLIVSEADTKLRVVTSHAA